MSLTALLRCHDVRTTRLFYRDTLGFEVSDTSEGTITARLEDGALIFTENDLWKMVPSASGTFYFTLADVDSYFESVHAKAQITWPLQNMPYGSREFGVRDCNGYSLAFQQRTDDNVLVSDLQRIYRQSTGAQPSAAPSLPKGSG